MDGREDSQGQDHFGDMTSFSSLSGAGIEKTFNGESASHSLSPVYTVILSTRESVSQANFHPGNAMPVIAAFWPGERLVVPREGRMRADALLCVLLLCIHLLILPRPLNLLPMPQLADKADNELFIAAIHLHTSRGNCFSL